MKEVDVLGVRLEPATEQPIVLLREKEGQRFLPIWIGTAEAVAIALEMEGIETARPMTHDLVKNILEAIGASVESVSITAIEDDTYFAEIKLSGAFDGVIDSRPSDAIAIAVRFSTSVYVADEVSKKAGIELESEDEEIARFVDFLDRVDPEDFQA
ncbi:MAG: bifunctional nuclease family protein [Actinomycetota bacterium]